MNTPRRDQEGQPGRDPRAVRLFDDLLIVDASGLPRQAVAELARGILSYLRKF